MPSSGWRRGLLAGTVVLVLVIVPAMGLLYYLDQRRTLESPQGGSSAQG